VGVQFPLPAPTKIYRTLGLVQPLAFGFRRGICRIMPVLDGRRFLCALELLKGIMMSFASYGLRLQAK
jgi:hypothetical protein